MLPDTLICVSPRSVLDLLVPTATWQLIKAAVARLSHGLGLSPRPSVCFVIAGVTRVAGPRRWYS